MINSHNLPQSEVDIYMLKKESIKFKLTLPLVVTHGNVIIRLKLIIFNNQEVLGLEQYGVITYWYGQTFSHVYPNLLRDIFALWTKTYITLRGHKKIERFWLVGWSWAWRVSFWTPCGVPLSRLYFVFRCNNKVVHELKGATKLPCI